MNKPLVASLLVAWCVLVVAPAWVVYLVFRGVDADTPIIGPIVAIWIVGYVIQLGVFMAVSRRASASSIVGWLFRRRSTLSREVLGHVHAGRAPRAR